MKKQQKKFFSDTWDSFDTLDGLYKKFKNEFHKTHGKVIEKYISLIRDKKIGMDKWGVHKGCVLYIYIKEESPRIGIECVFEEKSYKHPLGIFHIYVASWDKPYLKHYEKKLKEFFPDRDINEDKTAKNRAFLLVKKFEPEKTERIINALSDTYNKLKKILDEHEK